MTSHNGPVTASRATRRSVPTIAAAVAALLAACSDVRETVTGVPRPAATADPVARFTAALAGGPAAPAGASRPPTVIVAAEGVDVLGIIDVRSPCEDIRGELTHAGQTLRLRVVARPKNVLCIGVTARFAYRAGLGALPSGTYVLGVAHAYENAGSDARPVTVLTQRLRVP